MEGKNMITDSNGWINLLLIHINPGPNLHRLINPLLILSMISILLICQALILVSQLSSHAGGGGRVGLDSDGPSGLFLYVNQLNMNAISRVNRQPRGGFVVPFFKSSHQKSISMFSWFTWRNNLIFPKLLILSSYNLPATLSGTNLRYE